MADWLVTTRGVVMPQHCDHYGHFNVRYYAHFFDDGGFHMWNQIGVDLGALNDAGLGLVIANISIDFIHEVRAGGLVVVKGAFRKLGRRSMTYEQRMYDADKGTYHARQTTVEVAFDTKTRRATELPDDVRAAIEANIVAEEDD
jgi:acyl-CoA thioester hydrolase